VTVVIGTIGARGAELYADRCVTRGPLLTTAGKLHRVGRFHFALAGYAAGVAVLSDALQRAGGVLRLRKAVDLTDWKCDGSDGGPLGVGVSALITNGSALWCMDGTFTCLKVETPFWAIGSGAEAALGALHAGASPEVAIEIASRLVEGCGKGFDRVVVPRRRAR
jgi:ATP-dependent protease HslVU (ClpYQ) peptidase subunit